MDCEGETSIASSPLTDVPYDVAYDVASLDSHFLLHWSNVSNSGRTGMKKGCGMRATRIGQEVTFGNGKNGKKYTFQLPTVLYF